MLYYSFTSTILLLHYSLTLRSRSYIESFSTKRPLINVYRGSKSSPPHFPLLHLFSAHLGHPLGASGWPKPEPRCPQPTTFTRNSQHLPVALLCLSPAQFWSQSLFSKIDENVGRWRAWYFSSKHFTHVFHIPTLRILKSPSRWIDVALAAIQQA